MNNNQHEFFIQKCFELALKGRGTTSPNPLVGSVIVSADGETILGKGFHLKSGNDHAELDAIKNAKNQGHNLKGATLYCNLEPCCHTNKKTPPCAQRIVEEGIAKVIISNLDPNPNVAGNGVKILEENGIKVIINISKEIGENLNEVFFTHIQKQRPFIHLKWAQTLDGKMATLSGDSKWITGEKARNYCHRERELYDAILVGSNTAIKDDPQLTIRVQGKSEACKKRIVLGTKELPSTLKLLSDENKDKTIQITEPGLAQALTKLYEQGIKSVYIEGGAATHQRFIEAGLYDRISIYVAPKLIGKGILPTESLSFEKMKDALYFHQANYIQLGEDILIESRRNLCLQD